MNVSLSRAKRVSLTPFSRDAWNYASGSGTLRHCRGLLPHITAHSKPPPKSFPQRGLKFAGRLEEFANTQGQHKNDLLDTPTVVQLLREKLLDFGKITRGGERNMVPSGGDVEPCL